MNMEYQNIALKIRSFVDNIKEDGLYKITWFDLVNSANVKEIKDRAVKINIIPNDVKLVEYGIIYQYSINPPKDAFIFKNNGHVYNDYIYNVYVCEDNSFIMNPVVYYIIELTDNFVNYREKLKTDFIKSIIY